MYDDVKTHEDEKYFTSKRDNEVVILSFKENLLRNAADLQKRDTLFTYFNRISKDSTVKVIVLSSEYRDSGCEEYKKFYLDACETWDRNDIRRLCNVMNQFILNIVNSSKIFIHVGSGTVISLFMNVGMACDYSIVSENTVFCNPYLDIGLLPKGGGPFFLSHRPCTGKIYEILLFKKEISARHAVETGIADLMVPEAHLESESLNIAHRFGALPSTTLVGMKRLVNYRYKDLKEFLDYENAEIFKIVDSPEFSERLKNM